MVRGFGVSPRVAKEFKKKTGRELTESESREIRRVSEELRKQGVRSKDRESILVETGKVLKEGGKVEEILPEGGIVTSKPGPSQPTPEEIEAGMSFAREQDLIGFGDVGVSRTVDSRQLFGGARKIDTSSVPISTPTIAPQGTTNILTPTFAPLPKPETRKIIQRKLQVKEQEAIRKQFTGDSVIEKQLAGASLFGIGAARTLVGGEASIGPSKTKVEKVPEGFEITFKGRGTTEQLGGRAVGELGLGFGIGKVAQKGTQALIGVGDISKVKIARTPTLETITKGKDVLIRTKKTGTALLTPETGKPFLAQFETLGTGKIQKGLTTGELQTRFLGGERLTRAPFGEFLVKRGVLKPAKLQPSTTFEPFTTRTRLELFPSGSELITIKEAGKTFISPAPLFKERTLKAGVSAGRFDVLTGRTTILTTPSGLAPPPTVTFESVLGIGKKARRITGSAKIPTIFKTDRETTQFVEAFTKGQPSTRIISRIQKVPSIKPIKTTKLTPLEKQFGKIKGLFPTKQQRLTKLEEFKSTRTGQILQLKPRGKKGFEQITSLTDIKGLQIIPQQTPKIKRVPPITTFIPIARAQTVTPTTLNDLSKTLEKQEIIKPKKPQLEFPAVPNIRILERQRIGQKQRQGRRTSLIPKTTQTQIPKAFQTTITTPTQKTTGGTKTTQTTTLGLTQLQKQRTTSFQGFGGFGVPSGFTTGGFKGFNFKVPPLKLGLLGGTGGGFGVPQKKTKRKFVRTPSVAAVALGAFGKERKIKLPAAGFGFRPIPLTSPKISGFRL